MNHMPILHYLSSTDWAAFWLDVLAGFISSILALILGIPAGLLLDRLVRQINFRESVRSHLRLIESELTANQKILTDIIAVLERKSEIPVTNVQLTNWTTAKQQGFIQDFQNPILLASLTEIYRDLEEAHRRIEQLWEVAISGVSLDTEVSPEFEFIAHRALSLASELQPKIKEFLQKQKI